jgi:hypothetical protein
MVARPAIAPRTGLSGLGDLGGLWRTDMPDLAPLSFGLLICNVLYDGGGIAVWTLQLPLGSSVPL